MPNVSSSGHSESVPPAMRAAIGWAHACPVSGDTPVNTGPFQADLPLGYRAWVLSGYDAVSSALNDSQLVMSDPATESALHQRGDLPQAFFRHLLRRSPNLLNTDPPTHTRLRTLVAARFTPRRVERLREGVRRFANGLADQLINATADGAPIDLVRQFAFPLPIVVICDILGAPTEDRNLFRQWSTTIAFNRGDEESARAIGVVVGELAQYFGALVEQKRATPDESLISELITAQDEGDRLDTDELVTMLSILLFAGHETTMNLITNGVLALLTHPDQLALVRSALDLVPALVEECLRFVGPVIFSPMPRFTTAPLACGDTDIPAGEAVSLGLWAANRDPAQFADPHSFDIRRPNNHRHLGFGAGVHYCLGAPLARLEAQVAFETLLRRFDRIALTVPEAQLQWRPGNIRGPVSLPVLLRPTVGVTGARQRREA